MNQILSVEMPKNNSRNTSRMSSSGKKASTKSVIIFFCIILLILGIAMIALGIFSNLNKSEEQKGQIIDDSRPRIDITQNASELEVEIMAKNEISKVQYSWNGEELKEVAGNGTSSLDFTIQIPSGANTFEIEATDIQGITNKYTHEYTGPERLDATLNFDENTNSLKIVCQGQEVITYISYYYDEEEEQRQEINNTVAEIEIPIKQGEHDLTVKAEYEDLTSKQTTNKVYFPIVERVKVTEDGTSFLLKASDVRKITKVKMNFNGEESEEEVNSENFEKTLQLKNGENRLILTVYNSEGVSITRRTRWEKKQ